MEKRTKKKIKKKRNTHLLLAFSHSFPSSLSSDDSLSSSSVFSFIVVIDFGGRLFLLGDIFFVALSLSSRRRRFLKKTVTRVFLDFLADAERCVCQKLASREMAMRCDTANVSHSFSFLHRERERHFARKRSKKKFFVLLAREISIRRTRRFSPGKYLRKTPPVGRHRRTHTQRER
jgi:hypothetical protein